MKLPTPEELAFKLGLRSDMPFDPPRVIEATIRADREAIAKVVEEIIRKKRNAMYRLACHDILTLLRPTESPAAEKGE